MHEENVFEDLEENVDELIDVYDENIFEDLEENFDPSIAYRCFRYYDSESDSDDSEYIRWAQHTDSVCDICDVDSDSGLCEY